MISKRQIINAAIAANILEVYDFTLFLFFTPLFSKLFFPSNDANAALLMTYATFGIGFIIRPIGAIFFGYVGDRLGRKKALVLSISFMAIPSLLISILPTYEQIGISAPIFLAFFRLMQGFSASGELTGAAIFMIEHESEKRSGFASGLISGTCMLGQLIASLVTIIVTLEFMPEWGWRIAFLFGTLLAILGAYIRYKLEETPEFQQAINERKIPSIAPLIDIFKTNVKPLLMVIGIVCIHSLLVYTFIGTVGFSLRKNFPDSAKLYHNIAIALTVIGIPIVGIIGDKINNREILVTIGIALIGIFAYPCFYMLHSNEPILGLCGVIIMSILMSCLNGNFQVVCAKVFPVYQRYTGMSLSYNLGMAIFGGTVVYVNEFLIQKTNSVIAPAFYLMIGAVIGLISMRFIMKQRKFNSESF